MRGAGAYRFMVDLADLVAKHMEGAPTLSPQQIVDLWSHATAHAMQGCTNRTCIWGNMAGGWGWAACVRVWVYALRVPGAWGGQEAGGSHGVGGKQAGGTTKHERGWVQCHLAVAGGR